MWLNGSFALILTSISLLINFLCLCECFFAYCLLLLKKILSLYLNRFD